MNNILVKNLVKKYGEVEVLRVPDLNIKQGEILGVLGKNASGKSTLIKILSGLIHATSGQVSVFGVSPKDSKIKDMVKFVLESGKGFYDYLTAAENMRYFLSLNKIILKDSSVKADLDYFIQEFDFAGHLNKTVSELSQGSRQKLSIIVALLTEPRLICLDEPTNGLDLHSANKLLTTLKKISLDKNITVIATTHDLSFIKSIDSRSIILKDGDIIYDGKISGYVGSDKYKKYKFTLGIDELDRINLLNKQQLRVDFSENNLTCHVYDEATAQQIKDNFKYSRFEEDILDIEDVYYVVMRDD